MRRFGNTSNMLCRYSHRSPTGPHDPPVPAGRRRDFAGAEFHGLRLLLNRFEVVAACWLLDGFITDWVSKLLQIHITWQWFRNVSKHSENNFPVLTFIELDDGKIYRKPLYLMVKTKNHGFL